MNSRMNTQAKYLRMCAAALIMASVLSFSQSIPIVHAATFTVNDFRDIADDVVGDGFCKTPAADGALCTLRAALQEANFSNSPDIIRFANPMTITLTLGIPLPVISETVDIDATTTGGWVTLDGDGAAGSGFEITASNVIIKGLAIVDFGGNGIFVDGTAAGATNTLIEGNYVGMQTNGATPEPNGGTGIAIEESAANTITGNLVSGNGAGGIVILGPNANGNLIYGNTVGMNAARDTAVGNAGPGIAVFDAQNTMIDGTTGAGRNFVSGNGTNGIVIAGSCDGTVVRGNRIGTDGIGENAIPNTGVGVALVGTTSVTVGGSSGGSGNLISGNTGEGIVIAGGGTSNTVRNNVIGLDVNGNTALGNGADGIRIDGSANNQILENTISRNGENGIEITGGATGNMIRENRIGLSVSGSYVLGNLDHGILINDGSDNMIGGDGSGQGNTIANNGLDGISILSPSIGNAILRNAIYNNGGLGIDLGNNGVTGNDVNDPDGGANLGQNYPVFTASLISGGIHIDGTFNSDAARPNYRLEFYVQNTCDASGSGEGRTYIGYINVSLGVSGMPDPNTATLNHDISSGVVSEGKFITAAATYDSGTGYKETSEFSPCAVVAPASSGVFVVNSTADANDAVLDGVCDVGGGVCTLRAAIQEVNFGSAPPYTIAFNIPGSGTRTITLNGGLGPLPTILTPAVLDATTQPGYSGSPIIEVNGGAVGGSGFTITTDDAIVRGFSIYGFSAGAGISVTASNVTLEDNYIGLRANGSVGANSIGVHLNFTIGVSVLDNVISGNSGYGIWIADVNGNSNIVQGNYIGTNPSGVSALGNGSDGIYIDGADGNIIGGPGGGEANLISGNGGDGIELSGDSMGNQIIGNLIGTRANGVDPLGNSGYGLNINGSGSDDNITQGNVIANNGSGGVVVVNGAGNLITQNPIYDNGGLGISLVSGNNSQPAPTMIAAYQGGSYVYVEGMITAAPNTTYTIEFFSSPSGGTQGEIYRMSVDVTTGGGGSAIFGIGIMTAMPDFTVITATATDPNGNTSQFSNPVVVWGTAPTLTPTFTPTNTATNTPVPTNTFTPLPPTNTPVPSGPTNTPKPPTNTSPPSGPTNTSAPTKTWTPLAPEMTLTALMLTSTAEATSWTATPFPTVTEMATASLSPTYDPGVEGSGGGGEDTETPTLLPAEITATFIQAVTDLAAEEGGGEEEEPEEDGGEGSDMSLILYGGICLALLILLVGGGMELVRWLNTRDGM